MAFFRLFSFPDGVLSDAKRSIGVGIAYVILTFLYIYPFICLTYSIRVLLHGGPNWSMIELVLFLYSNLETIFTFYYKILAKRIQARTPLPPQSHHVLRKAFMDCVIGPNGLPSPQDGVGSLWEEMTTLNRESDYAGTKVPPRERDDPCAIDFRSAMKYWFHGVDFDKVPRSAMKEWISWSLFGVHFDELLQEEAERREKGSPVTNEPGEEEDKIALVFECLEATEACAGSRFPETSDVAVQAVKLTLDPINVFPRPLFIYLFIAFVEKIFIWYLYLRGFRKYNNGAIEYLVHISPKWSVRQSYSYADMPIVFLHGLGTGLTSYSLALSSLTRDPALAQRPVLIFLQPHISMAFFHSRYLQPSMQDSWIRDVKPIFEKWKFDKTGFAVVSHSNGSVNHSWLIKAMPELVRRSAFGDPICFCIWEPFVCYNFIHRPARTLRALLLRHVVAQELGVALVQQRAFNWTRVVLFPNSIPNLTSPFHTAIFLGGKDDFLNSDRIRKYLLKSGLKDGVREQGGIVYSPLRMHGGSMKSIGIIDWLKRTS